MASLVSEYAHGAIHGDFGIPPSPTGEIPTRRVIFCLGLSKIENLDLNLSSCFAANQCRTYLLRCSAAKTKDRQTSKEEVGSGTAPIWTVKESAVGPEPQVQV